MKLNKIDLADGKVGYYITMETSKGLIKQWLPPNTEIGEPKTKLVECMAIEAILRRVLLEGLKDMPELNLTMEDFIITNKT